MDARTWLLLFLLLIGLVASVVGWLCLEAGFSVMRLAIWAWNPTKDDAPPLEIILELDKYDDNPFPTCNKNSEEIFESKVLPLIRARDFLNIITSFTRLIEPFNNPDFSLYYTFTRKVPSKKSVPADIENNYRNRDNKAERNNQPENEEKHKLGELYHGFRCTTRVYTRDDEMDTFYSTQSNATLVDVGHHILEGQIYGNFDPKDGTVFSDSNNLDPLRSHHRSILEHIHYRLGARQCNQTVCYREQLDNDTISTLQRLREENGEDWKMVVEKGEEERNKESLLTRDYFMHPSIERERWLLDEI